MDRHTHTRTTGPHPARRSRLRRLGIFLAAAVLYGIAIPAQLPLPPETPAPAADVQLPAFDTVSIRENKGDGHMVRVMMKPNGWESTNLQARSLVSSAYGIRQDLISGLPDWATTVGYDVNAKVADEDVPTFKKLNGSQRSSMLLAVLQDRFKLQAHRETHTLPVYELVADKSGPRLPVSTASTPTPGEPPDLTGKTKFAGMMSMGPGRLTATGVPLQSLINSLAGTLQRTIIDKTGLTGKYDIELHWTPESKGNASMDNGADDSSGDIFTALREQLGLRLVPSKGPVETLVVDHIEKPSEN